MITTEINSYSFNQISDILSSLSTGTKKISGRTVWLVQKILERNPGEKPPFSEISLGNPLGIASFKKRFLPVKNMYYRDFLSAHHDRVRKLVQNTEFAIKYAFPEDENIAFLASVLARVHDLGEVLSPLGDIPTPKKRSSSPELKRFIHEVEKKCMLMLGKYLHGDDVCMALAIPFGSPPFNQIVEMLLKKKIHIHK